MEKSLLTSNTFVCRPTCMKHASPLCWKEHSYEESLNFFVAELIRDADYKRIFAGQEKQFDIVYLTQYFIENKFDGQLLQSV